MKSKLALMVTGYRLAKKQSGHELAREIGIAPSTLSSFERGRIVNSNTLSRIVAWTFSPTTKEGE